MTHPGELTDAVVERVAELLRTNIGLRPEPALRGRLRRCIREEAGSRGADFDSYLHSLYADERTLQGLLNRVTVQETAFFRHPEHFDVLAQHVLPTLPQPVRIWSAGCANGQEAFSLAMLLDELRIDGSIVATDLSTTALQRTASARYTLRELSGVSGERMARHLTPAGPAWEVNRPLRDRVTTLRHNLLDPMPDAVRGCQVVFCRNVLIYFSPAHSNAMLRSFADTLPDAWLFLGAAETIWSVTDRYETVRMGETYVYRPRPVGTLSPPARPTTTHAVAGLPARAGPSPARPAPLRPVPAVRRRPAVGTVLPTPPPTPDDDSAAVLSLARTGQQALADGDFSTAVIRFRKWVYLAHSDALAHLHLGLALEAAEDRPSAQRAFGAARRALLAADPAHLQHGMSGYAPAELLKLLDSKQGRER